ncbi:hypothetical protein WDU94_006084 [Cyamophila willieti]
MKKFLSQYLITLISIVYLLCQFHLSTSTITTKPHDTTKSSFVKNQTNIKHQHNFPHGIVHDSENFTNQLGGLMLFDFRKMDNLDNWENNLGSGDKASMALMTLKSRPPHQRAMMYTKLYPDDEAIGSKVNVKFDLSKYDKIVMYGRGLGNLTEYKLIFRQDGKHGKHDIYYEQEFLVENKDEDIELILPQFIPMSNGYFMHYAPRLKKKNITQMEIRVTGDIYDEANIGNKPARSYLELEWIKAKKRKGPSFEKEY